MKTLLLAACSVALTGPALAQTYVPNVVAQIDAMPKDLPPAKRPELNYAIQLAKAVIDECAREGGKASVLVTDAAGEPVVVLSGNGAGVRAQLVNITKAMATVTYKTSSGEVQKKAMSDPKFNAELLANPRIGTMRAGGFPIMKGAEMVGAIAVSGMLSGDGNEACYHAAMAKLPAH